MISQPTLEELLAAGASTFIHNLLLSVVQEGATTPESQSTPSAEEASRPIALQLLITAAFIFGPILLSIVVLAPQLFSWLPDAKFIFGGITAAFVLGAAIKARKPTS